MADDKRNRLQDAEADLLGGTEEQDVLFKGQMAVANFFLGYWKHGLALLGVVLVVAFFFGMYRNHTRDTQREIQAGMARVERTLPADDRSLPIGPLDDPADTERADKLVKAAQGFQAVAEQGQGVGAAMAWIRAAEVWQRARRPEDSQRAWQKAHEVGAPDMVGWAAAAGLAASYADAGKVDEAAALYRSFADTAQGPIAEEALLDLGTLYLDAGRNAESVAVLQEFTQKHPDSVLLSQVAEVLSQAQTQDAG